MRELLTTWVNLAAEYTVRAPARAAAADMIHSAARFDAAYTSGEYGRSALPVDAYTTWGTPHRSAAATTFLVPSTFVVTVGWTSRSASPGSRCAATWNSTSGRASATTDSSAGRSRTSARVYSAPAAGGHPRV